MAVLSHDARFVEVSLNTKNQSLEGLREVVGQLAKRAGCDRCGRVARLRVDFVVDPPAAVSHENIVSYFEQGF